MRREVRGEGGEQNENTVTVQNCRLRAFKT